MEAETEPKPKRQRPKQFAGTTRTPEQSERLIKADEAAWRLLVDFRFAAPRAIYELAYQNLGFPFTLNAFRARMAKHCAKGHWVTSRLGSRPESVIYLARDAQEVFPSTYEARAPAWNPDTARRGWLRSQATAALAKVGWTCMPGTAYLRSQSMTDWAKRARTTTTDKVPSNYVYVVDKAIAGALKTCTWDWARKTTSRYERAILLVEDPHKSIESQLETIPVDFIKELENLHREVGVQTKGATIILRPVDEISAWDPSTKTWARKGGRLAKTLTFLQDNRLTIDVNLPVPHLQMAP